VKNFKFYQPLRGKIAAVLFLLGLFPLTAMGSALNLDDIPRLPGSELKYSQNKGPENLHAEFWIFLPEGIKFRERGGEFIFKKDVVKEVKVNISPASKPIKGKAIPYIFLKFELKRLIPFEDVIGMDPGDVPRYPGSIRVKWMNLLVDFSEKYLVAAPLTEVKAFFEKDIPKYGWKASKGPATLNYLKGGIQSPRELSAGDKKSGQRQPLEMVKKMIPTTLKIKVDDQYDGTVKIGMDKTKGDS
jgi:hypothetical protein